MHLWLRWLDNGSLPIHDGQEATVVREVEGELRWQPSLYAPRILPLVDASHQDLMRLLKKPLPEGETLVLFIRHTTIYGLGDGTGQLRSDFALAVLPEVVEQAVPFVWNAYGRRDLFEILAFPIVEVEETVPLCIARGFASSLVQAQWQTYVTQRDERRAHWAAWEREAQEKRDLANGRALRLLQEALTPSQRASLADSKSFVVRGSDGHDYLICFGMQWNVFRLDASGQKVMHYCAHLTEHFLDLHYPVEDHMLAQKLVIESDVSIFLGMANSRLVSPPETISS